MALRADVFSRFWSIKHLGEKGLPATREKERKEAKERKGLKAFFLGVEALTRQWPSAGGFFIKSEQNSTEDKGAFQFTPFKYNLISE